MHPVQIRMVFGSLFAPQDVRDTRYLHRRLKRKEPEPHAEKSQKKINSKLHVAREESMKFVTETFGIEVE